MTIADRCHVLRVFDPSVFPDEPQTINVKVDITESILVTELGVGQTRSVWIEASGHYLTVHCYDPEHEEPINVVIGKDDISISTDRKDWEPQ